MSAQGETRNVTESRMAWEGQQNAGGVRKLDDSGKPYYDDAPRSEYPRMMYKATDVEQTQEWAEQIAELKDKPMVINRYAGWLCETCIVTSQIEAEALAGMGWDLTPAAAHGQTDGLAKAVSAKDDRIAELEAMLAAKEPEEPAKRGPGRPPKEA